MAISCLKKFNMQLYYRYFIKINSSVKYLICLSIRIFQYILREDTPFNHFSLRHFLPSVAEWLTIYWKLLGTWSTQPPEGRQPLETAQRQHLAVSTGTRPGPVQLNASEALPCVGSRTPSNTRPAPLVCVAGPGRYGRDVAHFLGNCNIV